jgi:hypothetical protein
MENSEAPAWAKNLIEKQADMIKQMRGLLEDKPASQKAPEPAKKAKADLSDDNIKKIVNDLMDL